MGRLTTMLADLRRVRQIAKAGVEAGLGHYFSRHGIAWCSPLWCRFKCFVLRRHCPRVDLPRTLRELFERLGPTFMKLGQVLSMRPDFVPAAFVSEFQKLQEHAPAVPFDVVEQQIAAELNAPLTDLFAEFETEPVASASLGQVHRATLHSGEVVAVKIQRPGIEPVIRADLRLLAYIARQLEKHNEAIAAYRPTRAVATLTSSLLKELDYVHEGRNAERFAYNFRDDDGVKIPKIFWSHTTRRVLTMEFIDGIRMGDADRIDDAGLDAHAVMQNCTRACLLPTLEHGFFHADPHPGNVLAVEGNRVCYLDFGMVGSIPRETRLQLLVFFLHFVHEDLDAVLESLSALVETDEASDLEDYKNEVLSMLIHFFQNPRDAGTMTETFYEILASAATYRVYFPGGLIMLAKSMVTGEAMCRMTHRDMDYIEASRPVIERVFSRELGIESIFRSYRQLVPQILSMLKGLPQLLMTRH